MYFIHLLLGRPLLLLPSPHVRIIRFSNLSDRITCPKNPSSLLIALSFRVSSSSIPIFKHTLSLVFFSVHDILSIFLHIHISHALIFCLCHCPHLKPYKTVVKISDHTILLFVAMLMCLSRPIVSSPIIVAFPIAILRFISLSHLSSFSTSDSRNIKIVTTSISSPSISKLSQSAVVIIYVFFMILFLSPLIGLRTIP